jgi:hypothetical protein
MAYVQFEGIPSHGVRPVTNRAAPKGQTWPQKYVRRTTEAYATQDTDAQEAPTSQASIAAY